MSKANNKPKITNEDQNKSNETKLNNDKMSKTNELMYTLKYGCWLTIIS